MLFRSVIKEGQYEGTLPDNSLPDEKLVVLKQADLERLLHTPIETLVSKHPFLAITTLAKALTRQKLEIDRKSTRLNSSHIPLSRMPSSA